VTIAISNSSQSIKNDLPDGWSLSDLGVVVDILDGQRVPVNATEREKRKGDIPYYGATGQVGWIDDYLFDEELILLGEDGAPFLEPTKQKAYIIRGKSWVNNHAHVLRARNGIPNGYIKYYLDIVTYHKFVSGTTRLKLNQSAMRRIPVPIAPSNEQKLIVSEIEKQFSRLDEAVAGLKRVKANLKRYKAAVLKAAVEGKLSEEWRKKNPDVEPATELLKCILVERKKKWEADHSGKKYKEPVPPDTSNLPDLPKGWVWATTDQLFFFVTSGSRGWAKYYSDDGPIFFRIGNLDHGTIKLDLTDIQRVKPPKNTEGSRTLVVARDILISITADVGMIGVIPSAFEEAYINQHISLARPISLINSLYLAWFLSCKNGQDQFQSQRRGATKLGLGLDDIKSVIVSLPPLAEQNLIVQEIERLFSFTEEIESMIEVNLKRAERLRQSILKKAFLGKLITHDVNYYQKI